LPSSSIRESKFFLLNLLMKLGSVSQRRLPLAPPPVLPSITSRGIQLPAFSQLHQPLQLFRPPMPPTVPSWSALPAPTPTGVPQALGPSRFPGLPVPSRSEPCPSSTQETGPPSHSLPSHSRQDQRISPTPHTGGSRHESGSAGMRLILFPSILTDYYLFKEAPHTGTFTFDHTGLQQHIPPPAQSILPSRFLFGHTQPHGSFKQVRHPMHQVLPPIPGRSLPWASGGAQASPIGSPKFEGLTSPSPNPGSLPSHSPQDQRTGTTPHTGGSRHESGSAGMRLILFSNILTDYYLFKEAPHTGRFDKIRQNCLFFAARKPYQEPEHRHSLGRMNIPCPNCRALHWAAKKLSSSSKDCPTFGICCMNGKVKLPSYQDPPLPLCHLLTSSEPAPVKFHEDIWKYNRALAFTSLGVNEDHTVNRGRGPPVFRISGEL